MYYINCFFVYSILGYLFEMIFGFIIGANPESGILIGPWTPIYGIASILIILISEKIFRNLHKNRIIETLVVFIIITVLLMLLEGLGGILIEKIFNYSFWDYTKFKYNIGKYMCLEMSLVWGISSIVFIYILRPLIDKIIRKIPKKITIIIMILFIIDILLTFSKEI